MEELYFTIAGCSHYFGSDFMEKGMKVKLEKEPDNEYDKEAIQVKVKGLGKIGYVANSPFTVKGESMSAGRLYDKIGDKAKGKVVFVVDGGVVCRIIDTGTDDIKQSNYFWKAIIEDTNCIHTYAGIQLRNYCNLKIKNQYLTSNDYNHSSFICYMEAVNNVYNSRKHWN